MSWLSLPAETRSMILGEIIQNDCIARYSTVCREWQAAVAQKTFGRLQLTPQCLSSFGEVVHQQRTKLVKHLELCIALQDYDCPDCDKEETEACFEANTDIIKNAIQQLFQILSAWQQPSKSLVLDISVYSPSDSKHYFKNLQFSSDAASDSVATNEISPHDPHHGWINGSQVSAPPWNSIIRIFEDIEMESEFWEGLPEVTAITGLLLRRQTRRRWEPRSLLELIRLLPRLQDIYYEPWREWTRIDQRWTDESYQVLFEFLAPHQLKKVVIFEDFDEKHINAFQGVHDLVDAEPIRTADRTVTKSFVEAMVNVESISASFIIDAGYFFHACQTHFEVWNNLVSLSLTSHLFLQEESPAEMNDLLQSAATAVAKKMSRLQDLELWNGTKGSASVFRYQASRDYRPARITWRGNWKLEMESRVMQAWKKVANRHTPCELEVVEELLDTKVMSTSHAIHQLQLLHPVVHPVSLRQMQIESSY